MSPEKPINLLRSGALAFGLLAAAACQSHGPAPATAGAASATARFQCGPTDDVELVVSVSTPPDGEGPPSRLVAVIGSESWRALERGERQLELPDASASQWCSAAHASCEVPAGLVFEFRQADLRDAGALEGAVEVRLSDRRTVHLPFQAPVARQHARCG